MYTRGVPRAETTALRTSWIGTSNQNGGYEELELADPKGRYDLY
jgi:hypothetical protein